MKPVYVINGFLESGKTEFITYTLAQPYFQIGGRTLLILCEEGENEYDAALLKRSRTVLELIEDEADFQPAKLIELEKKHKPERIIIEYNGMWNYKEMKLPWHWKIEQQITTIDASTFPMYYTNMKSLLAEQIRASELIIFNRCDGVKDLSSYKRNVKAINQGYGIWYLDSLDHLERYEGRTISFTAMVLKPKEFPKGYFVPGRMAMTCCAEDMAFLGFACEYDGTDALSDQQWVKVRAKVAKEYFADYQGEGPVLHAVSVEQTKAPKETVISFT